MNNLHNLIGNDNKLIWCRPLTARGHALGRPRDELWQYVDHLYEIDRGTPPPLTDARGWNAAVQARRRWRPYSIMRVDVHGNYQRPRRDLVLNPLCGPIRTRSEHPTMQPANPQTRPWMIDSRCANCINIAGGQGEYLTDIQTADPWADIVRQDQFDRPDPVSGL